MKVGLVVNKVTDSVDENIKSIIEYINQAGEDKLDLVVFPETAITGLRLTDVPEIDIQSGLEIDGSIINALCCCAQDNNINIAIGLLEREGDFLYDSAIFIDKEGNVALKYRRITSGWRDPSQDSVYKEGTEFKVLNTEFGNIGFLICGDLFNDDLVRKVKEEKTDFLIYPFARMFPNHIRNIKQLWEKDEINYYIDQITKTDAITLATNYIDEKYFGGAFVVDKRGTVIAVQEVLKEGILIVNM